MVCSHLGNFVKLCPSLHAEQGITMQFPPQRAKNQPNPAQDYTLLPTFSSSFHTLHFWVCLSLWITCSCNQLFLSLSTFSFTPSLILLTLHLWALSACVSALLPLLLPQERSRKVKKKKKYRKNCERMAEQWRREKQLRLTKDWLETIAGKDQWVGKSRGLHHLFVKLLHL